MSRFSNGPGRGANGSILGALRATEMDESKAVLPAEILAQIIPLLPIPTLLRLARTSSRLREMVYDDTHWVARLQSMSLWDEAEARRRFEDAMQRRRAAAEKAAAEAAAGGMAGGGAANGMVVGGVREVGRQVGRNRFQAQQRQGGGGGGQRHDRGSSLMFDAGVEEERTKERQRIESERKEKAMQNGFETMAITGTTARRKVDPLQDPDALLRVLKEVQSVRGHAREEYGKIYGALGPFYLDVVAAKSHADALIFRVFRDPEKQAQMLANLRVFAKSDWAPGWKEREDKLEAMITVFENAVLREFEQGYEFWDVEGRMKRYAHVLSILQSQRGVDSFIQKHPIFDNREMRMDPMNCLNQAMDNAVLLEPSRFFFETLGRKMNEQALVIEQIFPKPSAVLWTFIDKVREEIVTEYTTAIFDEARERSVETYLKAVSGIFEHWWQCLQSLLAPGTTKEERIAKIKEQALKMAEPHLDLYLADELGFFTQQAALEVEKWEQKLSEQDATAESFYMGNFNRQVDKKDFMSSFKKVVMMPVTVLPSLPGQLLTSPFGASAKASPAPTPAPNGPLAAPSPQPSRSQTPALANGRASPLPDQAPTDELAAKAALMASRLEGIKSLFSIEVALDLTHLAKTSLGRASVFMRLGSQAGGEAREQGEQIFVVLLRILGQRHVKDGFQTAVDHLSSYNPRDVSEHNQGAGVAPLVTFIELVNVGDLISQMIDVFYEQQLVAAKIADRNDFLDPAGLSKKKFEQMLDESVAAGLNKGIDALMNEVEYICATTQLPTDYNPVEPQTLAAPKRASKLNLPAMLDLNPSETANRVVDLVRSHTNMLIGSTEKTMLDVFNGEVGLRLFGAVCKHLKRQRISTDGAIKLIADMNLYFEYISTLRNPDLLAYFKALRELSQIYLIDAKGSARAKEMATLIADGDRFGGVFRAEEVYEFAERRADWYQVKRDVERAMYGMDCCVM